MKSTISGINGTSLNNTFSRRKSEVVVIIMIVIVILVMIIIMIPLCACSMTTFGAGNIILFKHVLLLFNI